MFQTKKRSSLLKIQNLVIGEMFEPIKHCAEGSNTVQVPKTKKAPKGLSRCFVW
jgi:hypothetical protein